MIAGILAGQDLSSIAPTQGIVPAAASLTLTGNVPRLGYVASGVHLDGFTELNLTALSCTDNAFLSWAGWFRCDWFQVDGVPANNTAFYTVWMVDPSAAFGPSFGRTGSTQMSWVMNNGAGTLTQQIDMLSTPPKDVWVHIMGTCDMNHTNTSKIAQIEVDGSSVGVDFPTATTQAAWTFGMNGKSFVFGGDGFTDDYTGDVADFSFWPGVSFLSGGSISSTIRDLFVDSISGKPRDPATAIATLGNPAIMLTGGPSSFMTNSLGTSGSLSLAPGNDPLTDSSSSP